MTYERFVKQLDGCGYVSGGNNCTCACEAMWLFRASQGTIRVSACDVRQRTGDRTGGTNLEQMHTVSAQFGIVAGALWRPGSFGDVKRLVLTGRYGAIVQIGYSVLANTDYDCFDGNFRLGHAVYVSRGTDEFARYGDPGADGRRPTIPEGWQDIPWGMLERAAGALPLAPGHTLSQEYGSGKAYAYLTPADPAPATFLVSLAGYTPLYDRPFGSKVAAVSAATYVCTRTKVSGYWWYRILTKGDGSRTANAGRFFTPNRYTTARPR